MATADVDQMQVFVIISKAGIMINADVNAKNQLTKVYAIKDLFRIQVIVNVNAINHVMFENIQMMKTIIVEKGQLINQLKSVLKKLMNQKQMK